LFAHPTGKGCLRFPGARPALLPAKHHASPGRFRRVRPFGDRTRPSPTRPVDDSVRGGRTCQASIRGDAASARGPGRPSKPCGSDAAGGTLMRRNRFRPFARDTLAPSTPMGQVPALAGAKLRKLPARGYGPRKPELTAFRRPGLPWAPAIRLGGRWGECGTKRKGVEKNRGNSGAASGLRGTPDRRASSCCDGPDVPLHGQSQPSDIPALTSRLHNPVSPSVSIFSGSPQCLQ
jgi:hypothetical protein